MMKKFKSFSSYVKNSLMNNSVLSTIIIRLRKKYYQKIKIFGGGILSDEIKENFIIFLNGNEKSNNFLLNQLENDIIKCYLRYGSTPQEYFLFGFRSYDSKRRSEFLTNQHKDKVMIRKVGKGANWELLEDKSLFYQYFNSYFNRDVCIIKSQEDLSGYLSFCEKNSSFIVKPIDGQCGKGIEIRNVDNDKVKNQEEFYYLLNQGTWILEELINQDEKMAKFNSSSVNTVRLPTFINSNGFHVLKPFLRVGRKGAIVDNGNNGGLFAVIDEKDGVIKTDGFNIMGDSFLKHPDTGIVFKDWQIPQWKELLELAEIIHRSIPNYPYIGWDFALTKQGWVLIEGNWGQFLSEFADKEGIRKRFDSLFN